MNLAIKTPRWCKPLIEPPALLAAYLGAKGGRGSGKSHFFAEKVVEEMVADPDVCIVCIREIQKSLKFSAKKLIEQKIRDLKVSHLFEVTLNEIKRKSGEGICIFQGMQDHTADSIKSLEGFKYAWVEEAQSMSARSLELLGPTIRMEASQIWFSWNPDQPDDPVEKLFAKAANDEDLVLVHVNFNQNPWCTKKLKKEAERHRRRDPDTYGHVWLGEFNTKSDDQVLCGRWSIDEFAANDQEFNGPYFGADWGFSVDPTTLIRCWEKENVLYIDREVYGNGVEVIDTPQLFAQIEGSEKSVIRADNARPELISHMQKHGYPKLISCQKWKGSVEDGITTLRSFEKIVIHPSCVHTAEEARLWKYKRDAKTNEVLPALIDKNNHCWDAVRYAIEKMIKRANTLSELLAAAAG